MKMQGIFNLMLAFQLVKKKSVILITLTNTHNHHRSSHQESDNPTETLI